MSSSFDPAGGWKQQTYPWASDHPASADDVDGKPARSGFWIIPAMVIAMIGLLLLLVIFAPEDSPPPPDGADGPAVMSRGVPLVVG